MEEDILKEKNEAKRNALIREQKLIEYIKSTESNFQNLFSLSIDNITIEKVIERYNAIDSANIGTDISVDILKGIHKEMVRQISDDENGIKLNEDGTVYRETEVTDQVKEIVKKEQERHDFIDDIINTITGEKKVEAGRIFETERGKDWLEKFIKWDEIEEQNKNNDKKEKEDNSPIYDSKANIDTIIDKLGVISETEKKLVKEAIKINESVMREVKYGNLDSKAFKALDPKIQYVIKRSLVMELVVSENKQNLLDTIKALNPELSDMKPSALINYMIDNTFSASDHILEIMCGQEKSNGKKRDKIEKLDEIDLIDSNAIEEALENVKNFTEQEGYYNKVGTINYKNFREMNDGNIVDAGMTLFKKDIVERMLFSNSGNFGDTVKVKLMPVYREYLIKEAAMIDEKRKDDPEFWKTIKPRPDTVLSILDNVIRENSDLLQEYMDGELNINFNKIKELEESKNSARFIDIVNRSMDNLTKLRQEYPEKKEMLFEKMRNIKNVENKEEAVKEIEKELRKIPPELLHLEFFSEKDYQKFVRENIPGFTKEIKDRHMKQRRIVQKNKEKVAKLQKEKIKNHVDSEKKDGKVDEEEITNDNIKEFRKKLEEKKDIILVNNSRFKGKKFKPIRKEKKVERVVATANKDISGATSLSKYMAKPKMIVDEIEIPVTGETNSEKASHTFETLLKEQGLAAKFKSVEGDLTVDEYASKMGEILTNINEKIKDGTLPSEININGDVKQTTLKDIVSMNFENTEILLENLPEDISKMSKEDIEKAIKTHIEEKAKEDKGQDEKKKNEQVQEKSEIEEPVVEANAARDDSKEDSELTQEELQKRLAKEQLEKMVEQEKAKEEVKQEIEQEVKKETRQEEHEEKKEDNRMEETALAKPTFFSEMKRKFLESKIGKKITEIFGKKEDKDVVSAAIANVSENSNPVTKDEGDFVQRVDGDKILRDAQKEMEEKRMQVGVGNGQKQTEIGEK